EVGQSGEVRWHQGGMIRAIPAEYSVLAPFNPLWPLLNFGVAPSPIGHTRTSGRTAPHVRHASAQFHHAARRRGGNLAARDGRAAAFESCIVRSGGRLTATLAMASPRSESLLAALPTELSQSLFAKARPLSLKANQTLFVAGDEGDGCYRVEERLLQASIAAPAGGERILAILGPGSVVGELSIIDGGPRSASITALRDSKLSFVGRTAFEAFGQSRPDLYRHVATLLARRLRDTDDALVATNFLSV